MNAMDVELDLLGQLPSLQIYTQICLCFAVLDVSHSEIILTLRNGLERLSANFPWLAGQVVVESSGQNSFSTVKVKPFGKSPQLTVKDFRHDSSISSMDDLRRARFPFRMLDENIIAPRKTLPGPAEETKSLVFLIQANFIHGGLILTIVGHHSAMDMTGQGQIINLLSKACRDDPFTDAELESGNLAGRNLIPLMDNSYQSSPELDRQILKPTPQPSCPPPKSTWANFSFDNSSLGRLKSLAERTMTSEFISTDDALSAFVWKSVLRARLPRLSPSNKTTLGRAVNVRKYFGIPETYTGVVQTMDYHTDTLEDLLYKPLGVIASQLRRAVDPRTSSLQFQTRALATHIHGLADKSSFSFGPTINPSTDIMISSWASVNCYDLDFGLGLGKPEAVRRPQFTPYECLIYLLPRRLDGEITVAISLRGEDMERLATDEDFTKFGKFIA
ncbi:hypothetical protein BBP40_005133 [Aspergillus hancockii]|nr:hypothetical protein BBP40_005133 [Aspergillus hancockii]